LEEKADNGAKNGSFDATGIPAFLYRFTGRFIIACPRELIVGMHDRLGNVAYCRTRLRHSQPCRRWLKKR
jgi:hypothetical protein